MGNLFTKTAPAPKATVAAEASATGKPEQQEEQKAEVAAETAEKPQQAAEVSSEPEQEQQLPTDAAVEERTATPPPPEPQHQTEVPEIVSKQEVVEEVQPVTEQQTASTPELAADTEAFAHEAVEATPAESTASAPAALDELKQPETGSDVTSSEPEVQQADVDKLVDGVTELKIASDDAVPMEADPQTSEKPEVTSSVATEPQQEPTGDDQFVEQTAVGSTDVVCEQRLIENEAA